MVVRTASPPVSGPKATEVEAPDLDPPLKALDDRLRSLTVVGTGRVGRCPRTAGARGTGQIQGTCGDGWKSDLLQSPAGCLLAQPGPERSSQSWLAAVDQPSSAMRGQPGEGHVLDVVEGAIVSVHSGASTPRTALADAGQVGARVPVVGVWHLDQAGPASGRAGVGWSYFMSR